MQARHKPVIYATVSSLSILQIMSYSPLTPLNDRIAVVTGGARGIGFETVKALKDNGAKVVIVDINAEAGEKAARDLDVEFRQTDLTKSADVAKLATDIRSK